jgi:hypothetical protein
VSESDCPGGGEADHEASFLPACRGGGAIGQRGQQALDDGASEALQGLLARWQVPTHLHRHQPGLAVAPIGDRKGGQATAGAG